MSMKLMSMVWDIQFPTQSQLLLALKLADFSSDDGQSIFPGRETLTKKCQCTLSTIDLALSLFKKIGLLKVVQQGGTAERPWSSTEYAFDMILLKRLSDGDVMLRGTAKTLEVVNVKMPDVDPAPPLRLSEPPHEIIDTPPSDPSEPPPPTGRRESIIGNYHHYVPARAKRSEQVSEGSRRGKKPPPRPRVPRAMPAPEAIALDRLRRRAEGFGVDVDEIMESIRRTEPRAPAAFFEALAINRLRHTGLVEPVLRAALRGEAEPTKLLFEVLLAGGR